MKKIFLLVLVICYLFTGCAGFVNKPEPDTQPPVETVNETENSQDTTVSTEPEEPAVTIYPLAETIMENLSDGIFAVSLEENSFYLDETGKLNMEMKIYSYDKYDMVDISMMKTGDTLVTKAGSVEITSIERMENGSISINGGLLENGFDLATDDDGIFYETGFNDMKNWYEIGNAILPVSTEFEYHDFSDLEVGEKVYFAGSFLVGEVTDYNFTPYNTIVRVENGQVVEMHRAYTP